MRIASPRSGVGGCEAGTDRSQDASHGRSRRCRPDRFRLRIAFRPDPRHARNRKHLRVDLAVIAVRGVTCGCDGPTALHRRAKQRASWLARHLAPPNGVPSRDCIRRLLMALGKEIVAQIVAGGGDCVIAVKDNQPRLGAAIREFFGEHLERDVEDLRCRCRETRDEGQGRIRERSDFLAKAPRDFAPGKEWPWIEAIGCAVRVAQHADGAESDEARYYPSTRDLSGERFGEAVRGHWSIESMRWVLDVTFREDEHRARERSLGNNLSGLRRFAVTLLKRHPDKDSLRGKRMSSMINTEYLAQVLLLQRI